MTKLRWLKPILTTCIFLVLVAAMGVLGASYAATKSRAIAQQTLPSLSHLALGLQYRGEAFLHLIRAVNSPTEVDFNNEEREVEKISNLSNNELQSYEDTIQSDQNRILYEDLMKERDRYIVMRNEILALSKAGNKNLANQHLIDGLLPMYQRYLSKSKKLVDYTSNEGVARADSIRRVALWSQIFTIISSILIFIFGFFLGFTR